MLNRWGEMVGAAIDWTCSASATLASNATLRLLCEPSVSFEMGRNLTSVMPRTVEVNVGSKFHQLTFNTKQCALAA